MIAPHFRNRFPARGSIDQHAVGRGQDACSINSGTTVDIHWLRRCLYDRNEQRQMLIEM